MPIAVGDKAPEFLFRDPARRGEVKLSDFAGQPVVLAFYPLAFTGGWTREMQSFRELQDEFVKAGVHVLGASIDTWASAEAFRKDLGCDFRILGDWPQNENSKLYEVYDPERFINRRTTFVIDKDGIVRAIIDDPRDFERHAKDALAAVKALKPKRKRVSGVGRRVSAGETNSG